MANQHRNEFTVEIGGKKLTIRPTLAMLEEKEKKFDEGESRPSKLYHFAGWILTKAIEEPPTIEDAVQMVWDAGFKEATNISQTFFATAYKTSLTEENADGKKDQEKPLYLS